MKNALTLLGGLTPSDFLRDYWQKKPLLIRAAIPHFNGLLSPNDLAGLACEEDMQSRLITCVKEVWQVQHGPLDGDDFAKLDKLKGTWTLLVQNVNHMVPEAADLLAQFSFIPHARLDDLMVSYAPKHGGIGAHVDSYDVFLLQGQGQRRWKISSQTDLTLIENAPLKLLKHFETEQEWVLEPGDMLYLPPHVAHWGIAESDDCMTYSIGFRAPSTQELAQEFLAYLQEHAPLAGRYADPDLAPQTHAAEISPHMVAQVSNLLQNIDWQRAPIGSFLGQYLSEPKPHVVFTPNKKISLEKFKQQLTEKTLVLDLKSQLLFYQNQFYLNGELLNTADLKTNIDAPLQALANAREIAPNHIGDASIAALADLLYPAYLAGFVEWQ